MVTLTILLLLTVGASSISAFQSSSRYTNIVTLHTSRRTCVGDVVISLSKDNNNDKNNKLPFYARAIQKLRKKKKKKKKKKKEESSSDDNANADAEVAENTDLENNNNREYSEVDTLLALANRMRLQGEIMDIQLTLSKIDKIERRIPLLKDDKEQASLMEETHQLLNKINGIVSVTPPPVAKVSNETKEENVVQDILDGKKPLLSQEKRDMAINGFEKLPSQLRDMMGKAAGLKDGSNSTTTIDKLMEKELLFEPDSDGESFSFLAQNTDIEDLDVFVNTDFVEINTFVESLFPKSIRKEPVNVEYLDIITTEVLSKDIFIQRDKPQAVPGGYLIKGESTVKSIKGKDDGDVLIEALDKKMDKSSVAKKVQLHYICDPTPPSGEEILNELDEKPIIFVTNYDISPDTQPLVKPLVSTLGLVSICIFSLGTFALNQDVMDRISAASDATDLGTLYDLTLPLALSVLAIQIIHEFGHLIMAVKNGIDVGLPTIVPGFQFGLAGGITPIRSSPKNIKDLFDFSIAGPLFGLVASLVLLYVGLEMTAFIDPSAQEQLPAIPLSILRSSALGAGIIEYLLGNGILNSPDPNQAIQLHPLALAAFGGLIINALSLLPLGNTDGGRISVAFFGRSFSRVVQGTTLLGLVLSGFFGADSQDTLLCYAIYTQFFQKEPEIPCRNEVDELDTVRGFITIATSVLVLLILTPLP